MTYAALETSISSGQPVELYEFRQALRVWRYTSGPDIFTLTGIPYEPATILRSAIAQSNDISGSGISLTFPIDHEFASQFLGMTPDIVSTLTIFRGHATDPSSEFQAYWKGRVMAGKATGQEITLECESAFTSMKRIGLRASYQRTCRHSLYSVGCGVNMDTFKVAGLVQSVSNNLVTCTQAGAYPDGWFTGGILRLESGAMRFITSHTAAQLTLARPFIENVGGANIDIFPGCSHLKSACNTKFSNGLNFGGFPYIPNTNPFGGSSIV